MLSWREYSSRLKGVLGLEGSPIAITYSMAAVPGAMGGKHRVCDLFLKVRDGATVNLSKENSACPGGTWHCGLGPWPTGKAATAIKKFLIDGEKIFCSLAVFQRTQHYTTPPPLGLAPYIVFSPLEKAELRPDLVLFICNAEQACRLVTLAIYHDGIPPKVEMAGATCHQAVAYPLVSGQMNVSLMDYTSRRIKGYKPEDLFVAVPYHKMGGIVESIDHCTAGTTKMEFPPEFRELFKNEDMGLDR